MIEKLLQVRFFQQGGRKVNSLSRTLQARFAVMMEAVLALARL
jgi:hypothetical protein